MKKKQFKVIGFDADDTLWVNEPYFQETERIFRELLAAYLPEKEVSEQLFQTEMQNLELYGYGAKAFMLSLIETALRISDNRVPGEIISQIVSLGKELLAKPVILLDGVEHLLQQLSDENVKLIVATKGDLLDQERKLRKSKLEKYFHHIEIMSDKKEADYLSLLQHLGTQPEDFLMIGNSFKSDILPVLQLGGYGIHVPFHVTWEHEKTGSVPDGENFASVSEISEVGTLLELKN